MEEEENVAHFSWSYLLSLVSEVYECRERISIIVRPAFRWFHMVIIKSWTLTMSSSVRLRVRNGPVPQLGLGFLELFSFEVS